VTFSDGKVAELVNANFVAAWLNRGPGFHNEDYGSEQRIFQSSMEAYPTKNICTFFLTPQGRVFHYVAGYFAPELFRSELEAALRLRAAAFDAEMNLKTDGPEALRKIHHAEAERLSGTMGKAALAGIADRSYRSFSHAHTEACAKVVECGLRYLVALHRHWSGEGAPRDFEALRFDYVYGNSFSEEPRRGAAPLSGSLVGQKE